MQVASTSSLKLSYHRRPTSLFYASSFCLTTRGYAIRWHFVYRGEASSVGVAKLCAPRQPIRASEISRNGGDAWKAMPWNTEVF